MWKLVIEDDESKRTVVPLTRDDYTIGRQEGNTIRLTERNVSRAHSRIRRRRAGNGASKDVFLVEDLQSYNGVFVNGLRVASTQDLTHGDLIQIGDYRIVLQDDAVSAIETAQIPITTTEVEAKATIPMASSFRGQAMTERPQRLVMLVGPTPGVEYPLDLERMTIGRAEDSSISVNHNSVSRLHCEVHALGDGRFEIVDKGSSNGVRVNGVELRRSIIEPGDVIELGDVRFKFVGAGQVFVPGPNESQQLTAISDREAELVDNSRRGWGGYVVPILAAGIIGAAMILGIVWFLRTHSSGEGNGGITAQPDNEQALVTEAKAACSADDCEASFQKVTTQLGAKSVWRDSADFHQIVSIWAEANLKKAQAETDPAARKALLSRVANDAHVGAFHLKQARDQLALLDEAAQAAPAPTQVPVAVRDAGTTVTSAVVVPPPPIEPRPRNPAPHTTPTTPTLTPSTAVTPVEKPPAPKPVDLSDRAGALLLAGKYAEVRSLLDGKVRSGHASEIEARQYRQACKELKDSSCR